MILFPDYPGNRFHIFAKEYTFGGRSAEEINRWIGTAKLPSETVVGLYVSVGRIAKGDDHLDGIGEQYIDLCETLGLLSRRPTDDEIAVQRWVFRSRPAVEALRSHGLCPVLIEGSDTSDPGKAEAARILGLEIISMSEWVRRGGPKKP